MTATYLTFHVVGKYPEELDPGLFRRNFPDLGELGNDPVEGLTDQLAPAAERGIGDDRQAARIRVLQEVQVDLERVGRSLLKFFLNTKV